MLEGFKYEGIWWPSEDRKRAISGTLNYVPNQKSSLNLIETFDNPKIIHGFSSDGKKITLYESHKTSEKHSFPGFTISEYSPKIILIGDHFSGPLNFTEISINYSYLDQWLGLSGFKEKEPLCGGLIDIIYKKPKSVEASITDKCNISIYFSFSSERSLNSVIMQQTAYIKTKYLEEMPLEGYDELMSKTMNLLCLAIGEPVYPLSISGRTKSMAVTADPIRIYYPHMRINGAERSIHPLRMLFTYSDISKSIDKYLKNWFLKAKLLEPTFDLYFDTMYTSRLTIQAKFLNMVQALEAYHRRKETMKQSELEPEEHSKRIESIIGTAPSEHKNWLRDILEYSNEVRLSTRLEDILNTYNEIINDFLPSRRNKKDFIWKVKDYRDRLTHYDPGKEPPKDEELIDIYPNVKKLVELCLLTEIGLSNEDIILLLRKGEID